MYIKRYRRVSRTIKEFTELKDPADIQRQNLRSVSSAWQASSSSGFRQNNQSCCSLGPLASEQETCKPTLFCTTSTQVSSVKKLDLRRLSENNQYNQNFKNKNGQCRPQQAPNRVFSTMYNLTLLRDSTPWLRRVAGFNLSAPGSVSCAGSELHSSGTPENRDKTAET